MANIRAIRKRISSVKSSQQITKAMKMVSAAKLKRAQDAIVAARPYARKMREVVQRLAARAGQDAHPLLAAREAELRRIHRLRQGIAHLGQALAAARDVAEQPDGGIERIVVAVIAVGEEDMAAHLAG